MRGLEAMHCRSHLVFSIVKKCERAFSDARGVFFHIKGF